jgi:hypothetical protein
MTENTRVRFDLWAVLGFLVFLFSICFGYLFNAQAVSKDERIKSDQAQVERIVRLETQYESIIAGQGRIEKKLDDYTKEAKIKKTNISDLKWR